MNDQLSLRDELAGLAAEVGGTYDISPFDGGTNYRVTAPGAVTVGVTELYGDEIDIVGILRDQLRERGLIHERHEYQLWFEGAEAPVTIIALTNRAAVALAGKGAPQKVLDLGPVKR